MKPLFFSLVIALLSVAIADFFIFSILDIKNSGYKPERFFQFDTLTGHFHRPNAEGYWYRSDGEKFYIKINSYGFSDSQRRISKTRPRIALIGDSLTEFWEVDEKYRGQFVLEDLLNQKYEVLNFGVRGYSTAQTYILFKNVGVHFSPDIVIYNFCSNDIYDNAHPVLGRPYYKMAPGEPGGLKLKGYPLQVRQIESESPVEKFLIEYSFFYRKFNEVRERILRYDRSPQMPRQVLQAYRRDYEDEDETRMEVTTKLISLLNAFTKERGMRFLVVEGIYSTTLKASEQDVATRQLGERFDFNKVSDILKDYCSKNGIEFLSLPQMVKEKKLNVSELIYKDDSMHLSREGIRFYAQAVKEKLQWLGWVSGS
ncbi:MAG TPA: SGNH/GDSL hydrolase family protein [Candidatus Omnitrophota bacterium]|nr:SGNH/GDSL hydrolase family protein [Candidatus Omnitrophota bacterium]